MNKFKLHYLSVILLFFLLINLTNNTVFSQDIYSPSEITKVILLGTGTPNPYPDRSGPAIAIIVNDTPYIIDCGPGVIRRFAAVTSEFGGTFDKLKVSNIKRAFFTHLHSDHTAGYPDLILTPWVMGRDEPLEVFGPQGLASMTEHILEAYREDINIRINGPEPINQVGWKVMVSEIDPGIIYKDINITVEAFLVKHGDWPEAYGFKFTTPDRTIVISGDTSPSDNLLDISQGADILIHEVYSANALKKRDEFWQNYHSNFHTSSVELAEIANTLKPELLILYHQLFWTSTEEELLREISETYCGKVVSGKDLDIF